MGLALYHDDSDIFIIALRSFVPNARDVIEKLRTVTKESLPDYRITIHGLKSISSNIAAEKLRKEAQELEAMAKSFDLDGIVARNGAFLEYTAGLISGIEAWLAELDSQKTMPCLDRPDPLLLACLKKSCEKYAMDEIDDVMDNLESACYTEDADLVLWLRERITELDFSAVAERLSVYGEEAE